MNNLFILLFFILGFSWAQAKDYSSAPERGVLIGIAPDKKAIKSTEGVKFSGVIKVVNKEKDEDHDHKKDHDKKTLLQEFQKEGLDIVGTFPSEAVDISNNLEITSTNEKEIRFSFTVNNINANDLNQFSVKVFNNHKNNELLVRLAQIKAKIEKRILALNQLKNKSKKENWSEKAIEYINKKSEVLNQLSQQIASNINSNESLLAQNTYALQVDNLTSSESQISLIMNKYRFMVSSEIGTTIEGMSTKITASVLNLRKGEEKEDHDDDNDDDDDKDDYKAAQFLFNGVALYTSAAQSLSGGKNISYTYTTDRLLPVNGNEFSVALYHVEENKLKKRLGWITQKIPVVPDTVKPMWLTSSSPSSANGTLYVQALDYVNLHAQDEFGRIDVASFKAVVSGSLVSGESFNQDVSNKFSKLKIGDGWEYAFSADINPLAEGLYNLAANIKDFALNAAETKTINFRIDRTAPTIALSVPADALTNQLTYQVPINVDDVSPTTTKIYVNEELQLTTESIFFTATLNLTLEGANLVKVVCQDIAGNVAISDVKTIVRDTTPPVLSNILPIEAFLANSLRIKISGTSNEKIRSATVSNVNLIVDQSGLNFSGDYMATSQGSLDLNFTIQDLAGNQTTTSRHINISEKLLNPDLVSLVPDSDPNYIWVSGYPGAARKGVEISVTTGFFNLNRGDAIAEVDGTFNIRLKKFSNANLVAKDLTTGDTANMVLTDQIANSISGIIKDSDNNPLINVVVGLSGSNISVSTNENGVFKIATQVSGDQFLIIDGALVPQSSNGAPKKFGKTKIAVNIGLGQENILESPIYLSPLILDGSETQVVKNVATTVETLHAPGVKIVIPSNAVQFPDGADVGTINMLTIKSDRTTTPVPENFVPTNVISLEPSGTKFKEPVQIEVPNDNELPAKTPMMFLSMNSSSGKWEVDGFGKVTDDGGSVVTNTDSGITHFSLVYAVPISPVIAGIKNPNILGVDTTQGGLETSIMAPSFKIYGQDVAPALIYKSGWANPTAVVSKSFVVSDRVDSSSGTGSGNGPQTYYKELYKKCDPYDKFNFLGIRITDEHCYTYWLNYYINFSYTFNWQVTNFWVPDTVKSQFFVGNISSDEVSFSNTDVDTQINNIQLAGAHITNAAATEILTQIGIPRASVMSYAIELKDKDSNKYLDSGIYPSIVRFQIKLKNLTITTSQDIKSKEEHYYNGSGGQKTPVRTTTNVLNPRTTIDSSTFDYLPQDSNSRILVQNKTESKVGRGWSIAGVQKIYNPSNSTVMLEEANGAVATYAVNNVISTVFDAPDPKVDLKNSVDLTNWPKAYFTKRDSQNNSYIAEADLSSSTNSTVQLKQLPTLSGELASQGYHQCSQSLKCDIAGCYPYYGNNTFSSTLYKYKNSFQSGGLVKASSGEFFLLDKYQHSFYRQGGDLKLIGETTAVDDIFSSIIYYSWISNAYVTFLSANQEDVNTKCISVLGNECGAGVTQSAQFSCSDLNMERTCARNFKLGPPFRCTVTKEPKFLFTPSMGEIGKAGSGLTGLNSPSAVISSGNDLLYIADTGNNRVISFNVNTSEVKLVAGNGQNLDLGDNAQATVASIFHPKALAVDGNQNLYIASENGYIRKVDSAGVITTIAGKPLGSGGVVSDESPAIEMSFSNPGALLYDSASDVLYVSDTNNNRVVQIDLASGIANKVAGNGTCSQEDVGDGKPALIASLCAPTNLGFDNNKNLLITDSGHKKIRRVVFSAYQSGAIAFASSTQDQSRLFKNVDGTWSRQYRDLSYASFNQEGLQKRSTDRLGLIKEFFYDNDKNLERILYPNLQEINFQYVSGYLDNIVDPAGRKTSFEYQNGLLAKVTYPDNNSRQFEYDAKGQMIKDINENSNVTGFAYNEWNRLTTVTKPDGSIKQINDFASQTMANNYKNGNTAPMNSIGLDENAISASIIDENNVKTEMVHDHMGFVSTIKDALGNITKTTRDIYGKPTLITRADNSKIEYKYDQNTGDLLSIKDTTSGIESKMTYDSYGNMLSYIDSRGTVTLYSYNTVTGQLATETTSDGTIKAYEYNTKGLISKITVSKGSISQATQFSYNSSGQLLSIADNSGKTVNFVNDLAGNKIQAITSTNGADQNITFYEFDKFNRILSVTNPKNQKTSYAFTKTGKISSITGSKGFVVGFSYNNMDRLIQKKNSFEKSYFYEYDKVGNKTKETDPNGNIKIFEYDSLYRLKTARLPDDEVNLKYDSLGNLVEASNSTSNIKFEVDSLGRVTKANTLGLGELSNYPNLDLNYSYDGNSNITSLQTVIGSLNYTFDSQNRLTAITNSWSESFSFNYDDIGRLNDINRLNNSLKSEFSFDSSGNLQNIVHKLSGTTVDSTSLTCRSHDLI